MQNERSAIKMPELLVFARAFAVGFVLAEAFRIAYSLGEKLAPQVACMGLLMYAAVAAAMLLICLTYIVLRQGHLSTYRLISSYRFDLLFALILGIWSNNLAVPWLEKIHKAVSGANPQWSPTLLAALLLLLLSPIVRTWWPRRKLPDAQFRFLADDEIETQDSDMLASTEHAKSFAENVLASEAHPGLMFGVDGPWGAGKTSFINLAQQHWVETGHDRVIVFRFEPLRYAADPDLAERFIRDLSSTIQRQVFIPEFSPAASRYSRMLKGKMDFSLFGFKLSLEPSSETIDELLEDIDDVLKRIRRRVIVVVDDLDRLEAKMVNNVLFTIQRTFKLSQATYVLVYDTENLVNGKDESNKAREFLEKFVTVKLSLFVDTAKLQEFLRADWRQNERKFLTIPSDAMLKLSSVLSELADIFDGDSAHRYLPLIGDLRKLKRFVNAALLVRLDLIDLGATDFNRRDLINLMLLHLNYPGLFRRIYAEETENRSGAFSAKRNFGEQRTTWANHDAFQELLKNQEEPAQFLLAQLFDIGKLGLAKPDELDEADYRSRACFNEPSCRNLEKYLKLIVRFATPARRETFKLYMDAVDRVANATPIASILAESDFLLANGEQTHDEFWRVLVARSYQISSQFVDQAIDTLVDYLPRYSSVNSERGLRPGSIYTIIRLLNRAGAGPVERGRYLATPQDKIEVAQRIFGEGKYGGKGLINRLASVDRGVLGWHDLMLFRLQCSADRGGQVFNVHAGLILHDDPSAPTTGLVSSLALHGMRGLSQRVFALFRQTYIETQRNFLAEVDSAEDHEFFGDLEEWFKESYAQLHDENRSLSNDLLAARSVVKSFVLYQLANRANANSSGVGCGFYDETGKDDLGGISVAMNKYVFDVCFNLSRSENNALLFADFCLRNLSGKFGLGSGNQRYVPDDTGLVEALDRSELKKYWRESGDRIKALNLPAMDKQVITLSYAKSYAETLPEVFRILDEMINLVDSVEG